MCESEEGSVFLFNLSKVNISKCFLYLMVAIERSFNAHVFLLPIHATIRLGLGT